MTDLVLPFQEKSGKLTKSQPPRILSLQDSLRFQIGITMGARYFETGGLCFVRGEESVNRDRTEMETRKMWGRSFSVLRPGTAEHSRDTCFQKTENFKNWSQS